ncbi:uncharacterized protein LOC135388268 isoform X2 [Ornithodoros turicata]
MVKRKVTVLRCRKGHPIYSREDIREQYCITRKELAVLDGKRTHRIFGCLANAASSGPCNAAFFSCLQRASSDDNIPTPPPPPATQSCQPGDDDDFASSGFRRRPKPFCLQDPKLRYSNLDSTDSDAVRIVAHSRSFSARSRLQSCNSYGSTSQGSIDSSILSCFSRCPSRPSQLNLQYERGQIGPCRSVDALTDGGFWRRRRSDGGLKSPDLLMDGRRPKHVSFDSRTLVRSNTVAGGLEDVELSLGPVATSTPLNLANRRAMTASPPGSSHERLLEAHHYHEYFDASAFGAGRRRALLRTQATQTDCPQPTKTSFPAYLTLSPRASGSRNPKHKPNHRRKAAVKENRRAGTSVSDDSEEDEVMEVDLINKQQRLLPSPKPHSHHNHYRSSESNSTYHARHGTEIAKPGANSQRLPKPEQPIKQPEKNGPALMTRTTPLQQTLANKDSTVDTFSENKHSPIAIEEKQAPSVKGATKEPLRRLVAPVQTKTVPPDLTADIRDVSHIPAEALTSPDSESSSSQFTERESSRSERSTSSSGKCAQQKDQKCMDTSDSTSEYATATEHSQQIRDSAPSGSLSRRDGTDTSFESASSASVFSSPSSRNGQGSKIPSPSDEPTAKPPLQFQDVDEGMLSDEETEKGHADSSDESTKKGEQASSSSESGEYSLGRAEGFDGSEKSEDDDDADLDLEKADLKDVEPQQESSGEPAELNLETFGQEDDDGQNDEDDELEAIMMPLMTFRDVQNAISRTEIRQYDELSTVSEVSEENSNSDQQITERYQPPDIIKETNNTSPAEESDPKAEPAPVNEGKHNSTTECIGCDDVTSPSFDTAATAFGSPSIECPLPDAPVTATNVLDQSLEISHASNISTTDSEGKSVITLEADSTKNDDSTEQTDSSASNQGKGEDTHNSSVSPYTLEGGAIPKQQTALDYRQRRERASKVRWETVDHCTGHAAFGDRRKEHNRRRSRSLSRSPESGHRTVDCAVCSQCGEKVRDHRMPGAFSWERPLMRGHCPDGRRSAPCPDYGPHQGPCIGDMYDDDDDGDAGIHTKSYRQSNWLCISNEDELLAWRQPLRPRSARRRMREEAMRSGSSSSSSSSSSPSADERSDSPDSTESEKEFCRQYTTITHRMIHRKASVEMYRRIAHRCFEPTKTVHIQKSNGEFGFRIHGSRPVVVSAIEKGTPAETCGLEVGDIIISLNGISVLEASHSEVVKLAHAGTEVLVMELARTCHVLTPQTKQHPSIMWGYLQRLSSSGAGKRWCRRWFVLKTDNRLYWYKTERATELSGAVMLEAVSVSRVVEAGAEHAFKVVRSPGTTSNAIYFAADDEEAASRWISALNQVACIASRGTSYMDSVVSNLHAPCGSLVEPDCQGYLCKLSQQWKSWKKRFLVLKDACLYFYKDRNAPAAIGAFLLHGYRVQSCSISGKKNTFEAIPPEPLMRHLHFLADTEIEKKRWLASMEYSIDRWIRL